MTDDQRLVLTLAVLFLVVFILAALGLAAWRISVMSQEHRLPAWAPPVLVSVAALWFAGWSLVLVLMFKLLATL